MCPKEREKRAKGRGGRDEEGVGKEREGGRRGGERENEYGLNLFNYLH